MFLTMFFLFLSGVFSGSILAFGDVRVSGEVSHGEGIMSSRTVAPKLRHWANFTQHGRGGEGIFLEIVVSLDGLAGFEFNYVWFSFFKPYRKPKVYISSNQFLSTFYLPSRIAAYLQGTHYIWMDLMIVMSRGTSPQWRNSSGKTLS